MLFTLAAVLSRIGFTFLSVYWKHFRDKGLSTRAVMGLSGPLAFVWIPLAVYFLAAGTLDLTPSYLGLTVLWGAVVLGVRAPSIYLYRYQGLMVSDAFRMFFSTIVAFAIDAAFFHTPLTPGVFGGSALLICGAVLLQTRRAVRPGKEILPWGRLLSLNALVAVMSVLEFAFYKAGLAMQDNNIFAQAAFADGLFLLCLLAWGAQPAYRAMRAGTVPVRHLVIITVLQAVSTLLYALALGTLSVLFVTLVRIAGSSIFAAFDHRSGEFVLHDKKSLLALFLIVSGLIVLGIAESGHR